MDDEISDSINGSMLNVETKPHRDVAQRASLRRVRDTRRRRRRPSVDRCVSTRVSRAVVLRSGVSTRVETRERSCCGRATRALRRSVDGDHTGCSGGRDRRIATAGALRTCDFALRGPVCSVPALHLSATASLSHPLRILRTFSDRPASMLDWHRTPPAKSHWRPSHRRSRVSGVFCSITSAPLIRSCQAACSHSQGRSHRPSAWGRYSDC